MMKNDKQQDTIDRLTELAETLLIDRKRHEFEIEQIDRVFALIKPMGVNVTVDNKNSPVSK
jgi:hypothetical protein